MSSGTYVITGGEIGGNTSANYGGGIFADDSLLTVGGSVVIKNNKSNNMDDNVYLYNNSYIALAADNAPTTDMEVWVQTVDSKGVLVKDGASEGDENYFKSDLDWKTTFFREGTLVIDGDLNSQWGMFKNGIESYETATENVIIEISEDFTMPEGLKIPEPANDITLTIKSKGDSNKTITRGTNSNASLFEISANANVIFKNITIDGNRDASTANAYLMDAKNKSKLTMDGVVLQNNKRTGLYVIGGTVTINDSIIKGNGNENSLGGGIYIYVGTITITESDISGNTASEGGGLYESGGTTTITDSTFSGNTADKGGGIYISNGATIINTTISNNTAITSGGGIYVGNSGLTLGGRAVIKDNKREETNDNVYLPSGNTIKIGKDDIAPTAMEVWVTTETGGHIAYSVPSPEVALYFEMDDASLGLKHEESKLVPAPVVKGAVSISNISSISGTPTYGETLTAVPEITSSSPGALSYFWLRDGTVIPEANADTYTLTAEDVGKKITVAVAAENYGGFVRSTTDKVAKAKLTPIIDVKNISGKIYDGTTAVSGTPTITLDGIISGDEPTATITSFEFESADAGDNKTMTVTSTLTSLLELYDLPSETIVESGVSITKADGLDVIAPVQVILFANDSDEHTFNLDSIALNKDDCGTCSYELGEFDDTTDILAAAPTASGTSLNYKGAGKPSGTATQAATITSMNYQDISIIITFFVKTDISKGISFDHGSATYARKELMHETATHSSLGGTFTYTYAVAKPANGALLKNNKPFTAGNYTVTVIYEDEESASIKTVNFTVFPAELTAEITVEDKIYDGTVAATVTSISFEGVIEGDDVKLVTGTASFTSLDAGKNIPINLSGFTLTGKDAGNYTLKQPTATASINKADISEDIDFEGGTATYNSMELTHETATCSSLDGEFAYKYAVAGSSNGVELVNGKPYKAGNYTVTAMYEDAGRIGSKTVSFKVNKKETVATITVEDKAYDGTDNATITSMSLEGVISGDEVELVGGTATFSNLNAGENIPINFSGFTITGKDAGNYKLTIPTGVTASINKADISEDIDFEGGTATYNGMELTHETATCSSLDGEFAYKYAVAGSSNGVELVNGKPYRAGNYTVTAMYEDAGRIGSKTVSFKVNKKETVATITVEDKAYDGTDNATITSMSLEGVISGDEVELVGGTATFSNLNAGKNIPINFSGFTITGKDAGNYKLTIPAGVTANIVDANKVLYGDVNDDEFVDFSDLTDINRYLAGWKSVKINQFNSDVYFDGKVNDIDMVILKRHLAEWDVTLGV